MAVTANSLTSGSSGTDGTSWNTASVSPGANKLQLLAVVVGKDLDSTTETPSVSGCGLTWVVEDEIQFRSSALESARLVVYRALGASPTTGALTISTSATHHNIAWSLVEFGNILTTGSNGANAVRQSVTASGSGSASSVTLAAFGDADNATYGAFGLVNNSTFTPGSGFTELHDVQQSGFPPIAVATEWKTANDTGVDGTWASSDDWGGIAIEIVEFVPAAPAESGSVIVPTSTLITAVGMPDPGSDFDYISTIQFDSIEDLSERVRAYSTSRGRPFNLDRIEAGTARILYKNGDGELDPANPDSSYYPNIRPLRETWLARRENGVTYNRFYGAIERFVPTWVPAADYQEIETEAADAFETLANTQLVNDHATLTTTLTGSNNDLVYTAVEAGARGDDITVAYVVSGNNTPLSVGTNDPLEGDLLLDLVAPPQTGPSLIGERQNTAPIPAQVTVQGSNITVTVATNGSGVATSTANQVLAALQASQEVTRLVTVALAPSNDGTGVVTALTETNLSGGKMPEELTGDRINRVLDEVGWPTHRRQIDDGVFNVVADGFSEQQNMSALSHIQDVADSELGYVFINGAGDVVFHDGAHRSREDRSTVSQATFTDQPDATGMTYQDLTLSLDKDRIWNRVIVTGGRAGAVPQMVEDTDSQEAYSPTGDPIPRTYTKNTLLANDDDAAAVAQVILNAYKDARTRIEQVVLLETDQSGWSEAVLGREIGDRITISMSPPGWGSTVAYECFVEQIQDDRAAGQPWQVRFRATPIAESVSGPPGGGGAGALLDSSGDSFTLDSATLGVLG